MVVMYYSKFVGVIYQVIVAKYFVRCITAS